MFRAEPDAPSSEVWGKARSGRGSEPHVEALSTLGAGGLGVDTAEGGHPRPPDPRWQAGGWFLGRWDFFFFPPIFVKLCLGL